MINIASRTSEPKLMVGIHKNDRKENHIQKSLKIKQDKHMHVDFYVAQTLHLT